MRKTTGAASKPIVGLALYLTGVEVRAATLDAHARPEVGLLVLFVGVSEPDVVGWTGQPGG
jgi:hypothetical protein